MVNLRIGVVIVAVRLPRATDVHVALLGLGAACL